MRKQILNLLFIGLCIGSINGCNVYNMQRPAHSISIDTMQIDKNLYKDLNNFIKLEIFFVRKKYFSWNPKQQLSMLLTSSCLKVYKFKDVVGHHVYQIFSDHIIQDNVFIPSLVVQAFFIVKRNEQIIHHREIEICPVYTRSIFVKFLGNDLYIKCQ